MVAKDFRRIALGLKDAVESAHMGHPDFRVGGKIFATLQPDNERGVVKLTPEQQAQFVRDFPRVFEPASGAWGRQGYTTIRLAEVDEEAVGEALTRAWQNTAKKPSRTTRKSRS